MVRFFFSLSAKPSVCARGARFYFIWWYTCSMCGIFGYIGNKQALPIVLDGLRRLEYRGYDSAGVALPCMQTMFSAKAIGRIAKLEEALASMQIPMATAGIGHTRWATHGVPSQANAHPHSDCSGALWVCHNGIIENWR